MLSVAFGNFINITNATLFIVTGGGEGDVKNATPLERANWFDRFVVIKEVFDVSKSSLFCDYRDERVFTGGFKI